MWGLHSVSIWIAVRSMGTWASGTTVSKSSSISSDFHFIVGPITSELARFWSAGAERAPTLELDLRRPLRVGCGRWVPRGSRTRPAATVTEEEILPKAQTWQ